jgi:site-specific DNA-cytosine methylase
LILITQHRAEGNPKLHKDITNLPLKTMPSVDLLLLGTSCKGFSHYNNHVRTIHEVDFSKPQLSSGNTWTGAQAYICAHRPKVVLFENVWGICRQIQKDELDDETKREPGEKNIDVVVAFFKAQGYAVGFNKLNSANFCLPQTRRRVWLWAELMDSSTHELPLEAQDIFQRCVFQVSSSTGKSILFFC